MKPFDLEAAKRGEPIISRNGNVVEFVARVPVCGKDSRRQSMADFRWLYV